MTESGQRAMVTTQRDGTAMNLRQTIIARTCEVLAVSLIVLLLLAIVGAWFGGI